MSASRLRLGAGIPALTIALLLGQIAGSYAAAPPDPGKPGTSAPPAAAQPASGSAAPAPSQPQAVHHFDILEYVVDGNSVLPVPDVEEAVYPFLGEARTASDVDHAREALQQLYRSRGYQTVQVSIPKQGVESGTIHLKVTENRVERLRVVGSNYHSLEHIADTASSLSEGKVPNVNEMQNDIVALNQQPGLKVTPRLKPGKAPGTVDVDLVVQDKPPLHASLEVNNQYNQKTTPLRLVGTVSYDNLWQLGHTISLTAQTAPLRTSDAKVVSGSYMFRLPDTPFTMLFYGLKSDSDVAAISTTDVIGKGTIFGVRAIATLPGTDTFYSSATIGLDRKNLTQNVLTAGVPNNAPVLYYPMTLAYAPVWHEGNVLTEANLSLNFALPGLGNGSNKFDAQRFNAVSQYLYGKVDFSETVSLPWGGSAYMRVLGQLADGPLLSSEQFSAGGANSVRGYLEAEELGDSALLYSFEFRSPSIAAYAPAAVNEWHFLAFADAAGLWLRQPLPGQERKYSIAGVGLGTRFTAFDILNGAVDVGYPLQDGTVTKAGKPRVHFRFWMGL